MGTVKFGELNLESLIFLGLFHMWDFVSINYRTFWAIGNRARVYHFDLGLHGNMAPLGLWVAVMKINLFK